MRISSDDVKFNIVTKDALAENFKGALPRLNGSVKMDDKESIEAFLSVDNLRPGWPWR